MSKFKQALAKLFGIALATGAVPKKLNMSYTLEDGSKIYVMSEDEDAVGDAVVLQDEAGNPLPDSPAPDGEWKVTSEAGTSETLVISGGIVTSQTVTEVETETESLPTEAETVAVDAETEQGINLVLTILGKMQEDVIAQNKRIIELEAIALKTDSLEAQNATLQKNLEGWEAKLQNVTSKPITMPTGGETDNKPSDFFTRK
jgi:rRNA maturation endonuclease Nob1